jgi:hypothetical protein
MDKTIKTFEELNVWKNAKEFVKKNTKRQKS